MKTSLILAALIAAVPAIAAAQDNAKIRELDRKIDILTREIEQIKLGSAASGEPAELKSTLGFGPAASKVYNKSAKRVSIGGYGEMVYENFKGRRENNAVGATADQLNFLRAVLYVGYKFNDWITFNSEIEFEHATEAKRGEVGIEMAQLDFKFHDLIGVRTGLMLVPMGLINEMHEPTTFHGVNRPSVESNIIPSTWRENGVGVFGKAGPLSYRSYLMNGQQAATDTGAKVAVTGFSAGSGLRNGRTKGSKSKIEDYAWVSRVDITPIDGIMVGGSYYTGQADQQMVAASIPVDLWEVHGRFAWKGAELRALYADGHIGNVDVLNLHQGNAPGGTGSVGSDFFGGYIEIAYDVLSLCPQTDHSLSPFFRYERYDTQKGVPEAWTKNPSNSRLEWTLGLDYKPIPRVAVKFEHQIKKNQGRTGLGQTNLGIGYIF